MRWLALVAVLAVVGVILLYRNLSLMPPEREIQSDGITSDPECFDLLVRVARRERAIFEEIERKEKPISLRCSNVDIVKVMQREGGRVNDYTHGSRLDFDIKSQKRWLFAK